MSTVKSNILELENKLAQLKQLEQQQAQQQVEIENQRLLLDDEHQEKLLRQQQIEEITGRLLSQINELQDMGDLHTVAERLSKELNEVNRQIQDRHYQVGQRIKHLKGLWTEQTYNETGKVGTALEYKIREKLSQLLEMPGHEVNFYLK